VRHYSPRFGTSSEQAQSFNAQCRDSASQAAFNFGIEKDFLLINPIDKFRTARIHRREVKTIPVAVVEKMLCTALQTEPGYCLS